jgi:regulatory subunit for Cdc7p protein kinase
LISKTSIFDTALQNHKTNNGDILYKAKELGMKLWTVDKLEKILDCLLMPAFEEDVPAHVTRYGTAAVQQPKPRQADLQKLLENEKLYKASDLPSQDLIQLRGFYVYVHDMDELTRPVMVREYTKVAKREDGKWPQFRISGSGKCPFVEDRDHVRRQQQEDVERARRAAAQAPRTRAVTANHEARILNENNNLARRPSAPTLSIKQEEVKPLDAPKVMPPKRANTDGMPPMFGSAQASLRAMPRFIGGEPVASGLQQSNITSAIRSQAISSTAAAPGARAGNSKEVNQLKRKVLEKNSVPSANTNSGHSSTMNDVHLRAAFNQEYAQPMRAAKRKAQETMGLIREDDEEKQARKMAVIRRKKTVEKELKPGYCENCREKFNDFDEVRSGLLHILLLTLTSL